MSKSVERQIGAPLNKTVAIRVTPEVFEAAVSIVHRSGHDFHWNVPRWVATEFVHDILEAMQAAEERKQR